MAIANSLVKAKEDEQTIVQDQKEERTEQIVEKQEEKHIPQEEYDFNIDSVRRRQFNEILYGDDNFYLLSSEQLNKILEESHTMLYKPQNEWAKWLEAVKQTIEKAKVELEEQARGAKEQAEEQEKAEKDETKRII